MLPDLGQAIPAQGLHLGTYEQARMRNSSFLHQFSVGANQIRRTRDRQDWSRVAAGLRKSGYDAAVYLNRYEGMRIERLTTLLEQGLGDRLDKMSDAEFRKLVPEAQDSLLVVNPEVLQLERIIDRSGELVWTRDAGEVSIMAAQDDDLSP